MNKLALAWVIAVPLVTVLTTWITVAVVSYRECDDHYGRCEIWYKEAWDWIKDFRENWPTYVLVWFMITVSSALTYILSRIIALSL